MRTQNFRSYFRSRERMALAGVFAALTVLAIWVVALVALVDLADQQLVELNETLAPTVESADVPVATGPQNRTDCDTIRRTAFRSAGEIDWFAANCEPLAVATLPPPASAAAPPAPASNDRTDCEEIRGTSYRSPTEREFFLTNCVNR